MLENAADIDFLTDPTKEHQSRRHGLTFPHLTFNDTADHVTKELQRGRRGGFDVMRSQN